MTVDRYIQDQLGRDEPMSADLLKAAVERGLMESQTCEFKADHRLDEHGNPKVRAGSADAKVESKKILEEITKDIAGMANGGGGIIVYGIGEEKESRAGNVCGVIYNGRIEKRFRDVARSINPIPSVSLDHYDYAREDRPFLVLTISPVAPIHWTNEGAAISRRRGTHTEWVTGPEVENMVLEAFAAEKSRKARADTFFEEVEKEVDLTRPWICGLAVPALGCSAPHWAGGEDFNSWARSTTQAMSGARLRGTTRVEDIHPLHLRRGIKRWIAGHAATGQWSELDFQLQVRSDGSVAWAQQIADVSHFSSDALAEWGFESGGGSPASLMRPGDVNRVAEVLGACVATVGAAPGGVLLQMRPLGNVGACALENRSILSRRNVPRPRSLELVDVETGPLRSPSARDLLPFVGLLATDFISQMGHEADILGHDWDETPAAPFR